MTKMNNSAAVVLVIVALIITPDPFLGSNGASVNGLSCPCYEDETYNCTAMGFGDTTDCPVGEVWDACACCKVCAKNINEKCGGPWDVYGTCGQGLTCVKSYNDYQADGLCQVGCQDEYTDCPGWAARGDCKTGHGFALDYCKLSCNLCEF